MTLSARSAIEWRLRQCSTDCAMVVVGGLCRTTCGLETLCTTTVVLEKGGREALPDGGRCRGFPLDLPPTSKPLRIFVVEDHEGTAKYLCLYLELLGHSTVCAATMTKARKEPLHAGCDVILRYPTTRRQRQRFALAR